MGERRNRTPEVGGSNPPGSTSFVMKKFIPFKGVRFSPKAQIHGIPPISQPYDKITPQMYEIYLKNPFNIARIILPGGYGERNYELAKRLYNEFLSRGILKLDDHPGYYFYQVEFELNGRKFKRNHLIGLLKLPEDENYVYAHERTFPKTVEDRLNLLRATRVNFGQVFLLVNSCRKFFEQPEAEPLHEYRLDDKIHRLWFIPPDPRITDCFESAEFVIADGHHRFKTAMIFRDEMKEKGFLIPAIQYRMVSVSHIDDEGLVILPTHRAARRPYTVSTGFSKIDSIERLRKLMKENIRSLGVITKKGIFFKTYNESLTGAEYLEKVIFVNYDPGAINYFREIKEGFKLLESGEYEVLFILNPPDIKDVWNYATSGKLLPEKSTDFYPKVPTGLVLNDMNRSFPDNLTGKNSR